MNALAPGGSRRSQPRRRLCRIASLLVLLSALFTLAPAALTKLRSSGHDEMEDLPTLDSFSEPGIAVALLKMEADRVFGDYVQHEGAHLPNTVGASDLAAPQADTPLARLEKLHQQMEDLARDLDDKLMIVYAREGCANHFVERYLDRLGARTEDGSVGLLAWTALFYAEQCQRTAELVHPMQDFTALHPELKPSPKLTRAVDDWRAQTDRSPYERTH